MDATDIELLRAYVESGKEASFEELVKRHVTLVYSTALRKVGGDVHLAQDVAQMVFTHLAQNARSLLGQRALAGWLYRDAFFSASKLVRSERRRLEREKQAMMPRESSSQTETNELVPMLEEVISGLRPRERDALVLRFFKGMESRTAAALLAISEDAFQKRVERAVHKLRAALASKGVLAGPGIVTSALLSGGLVASAPQNLAAMVAASSLTSATAVNSSTLLAFISNFTMTKLKIAGAALLLAAITAPLFIQQNALSSLREQNRQLRFLRQESSAQNNNVTRLRDTDPTEVERMRSEHLELMRLRGEVGVSRRQIEELRAKLEPQLHGQQRQEAGGPYYAAETWANVGFQQPQSAVITLLWALRNGNQGVYSSAFGRDMPGLEDAWINPFKSVKGSLLSNPEQRPNGDVRVNVVHETVNGDVVNTLITYRQENGQWLVRSMAGFPTGILDASSQTAKYVSPKKPSSSP